jgi:hypothetical protein
VWFWHVWFGSSPTDFLVHVGTGWNACWATGACSWHVYLCDKQQTPSCESGLDVEVRWSPCWATGVCRQQVDCMYSTLRCITSTASTALCIPPLIAYAWFALQGRLQLQPVSAELLQLVCGRRCAEGCVTYVCSVLLLVVVRSDTDVTAG